MEAIIIEDKLEAIFAYLPAMTYTIGGTTFNPVFRYGDQKELNVFIKSYESESQTPYPLIWLLYPSKEMHHKNKVQLEDLTLILIVNTNDKMLNKERLDTTYRKVLLPLYENIFSAFQKAVNVNLLETIEVTKFPNYGDTESNSDSSFTVDLWDALKTVWKIEITRACLKTIKI